MSRLFIRLYLDEDVDPLVATLVRYHGYDARTAQEAGQSLATDADQLACAVRDGRCLVTHNREDFLALFEQYRVAGRLHHGIVLAFRRPTRELTSKLVAVLNQLTADEMTSQILYL